MLKPWLSRNSTAAEFSKEASEDSHTPTTTLKREDSFNVKLDLENWVQVEVVRAGSIRS